MSTNIVFIKNEIFSGRYQDLCLRECEDVQCGKNTPTFRKNISKLVSDNTLVTFQKRVILIKIILPKIKHFHMILIAHEDYGLLECDAVKSGKSTNIPTIPSYVGIHSKR